MKSTFLSILIIILTQSSNAQEYWIIKGGFNYSRLQKIDNQPFYSYSIGIERKIQILSFFSINPEILWSGQGGTIKNKPVWSESFYGGSLYRFDINIERGSMDLALVPEFLLYESNDFAISLRPYPSFHTEGYGDHDLKEIELININDSEIDWANFNFEYRQGDFEHFPFDFRTGWSLNMAITVSYERYIVEVRYMRNLHSIGQVAQLYPLKHKLHSIHFLFGIAF